MDMRVLSGRCDMRVRADRLLMLSKRWKQFVLDV